MTFKHAIKLFALRLGVEMHWYTPAQSSSARLFKLIAHHGVDVILDVGANAGQYGRFLRFGGYSGSIISFEPLSDAHCALSKTAQDDPKWIVAPRMALGDTTGRIKIHVAGNSTSSSVLPMREAHERAAPTSKYVESELVNLRRLDDFSHPALDQAQSILLKIDTQGYEKEVLAGAKALLGRIRGIQVELSLMQLYSGQAEYREIIDLLEEYGFELWSITPGFVDPATGRMLQMDGIFFRPEAKCQGKQA